MAKRRAAVAEPSTEEAADAQSPAAAETAPPDANSQETSAAATAVEVTFKTPSAEGVEYAALVGDFNDWSADATPMQRVDDHFEATLSLPPDREYRYRVLLDGSHWENDPRPTPTCPTCTEATTRSAVFDGSGQRLI